MTIYLSVTISKLATDVQVFTTDEQSLSKDTLYIAYLMYYTSPLIALYQIYYTTEVVNCALLQCTSMIKQLVHKIYIFIMSLSLLSSLHYIGNGKTLHIMCK